MTTIGTETIKSPIGESKLFKKSLCDYVVNVASGCLHGCTFCCISATPMIRARVQELRDRGVEDPQMDWGEYLFVRDQIPAQIKGILDRKQKWKETPTGRGVTMLSIGTDAYQNLRTARVTRAVASELLEHGRRVRVLTRSPLWVRDIELYQNSNATVGMSIPYLDDLLSRQIEPKAPLPSHRFKAMQKAKKAGVRRFIAMAPTPPMHGFNDFVDHLHRLMELEPEVIFWEPINTRPPNHERMLRAGLEWTKDIISTKSWADYFLRQWEEVERASEVVGCDDRLHIWVDNDLRRYTNPAMIDYWQNKPTPERWEIAHA